MVDGVTINNSYRGSIYHYLDFPIEMVQRIEVIRGAGSILYGSGAISGVVNIITRSADTENQNSAFLSGGTYENNKVGALVSTDVKGFKVSLDAYSQNSNTMIENTDRHLKDSAVGLRVQDDHFALVARVKKSSMGNAYGVIGVEDSNREKYFNVNGTAFVELSYKNNLSKNNKIALSTGYNRYGQDVEAAHPSATIDKIDAIYKEDGYFAQLDLISSSIDDNELLLGAKFETAKTITSVWEIGNTHISPASNPDFTRAITSLYLNDNYILSSSLDISAGVRYDHYSDFGNSLSPTVGAVYRVTKKIKLKALYSHAFRAPSWVELTSNPNLQAEKSDSLEAGIIYKPNNEHIIRANFYTSKIDDMIIRSTTYLQDSFNKFRGSELEYIYMPNNQIELNFFASYIDAKDKHDDALVDIANVLASTALIYDTSNGFSFGSLLKYVSSSKRSKTDTRDELPQSFIFDQTISYNFKNFTARLIVKDLFDNSTYYALPPSATNNDFNDGGRTLLLKAEMKF
jgi:outer membrane receptor protein involved in Fe transport